MKLVVVAENIFEIISFLEPNIPTMLCDKTNTQPMDNLPVAIKSPKKNAAATKPPKAAEKVVAKGESISASSEEATPKEKKKTDEEMLLAELAGGGASGFNTKSSKPSLQDNFAKFRAERARVKKMQRANKKALKGGKKTEADKEVR